MIVPAGRTSLDARSFILKRVHDQDSVFINLKQTILYIYSQQVPISIILADIEAAF
ncbi:uncharacterized protein SOCG_01569 [Schizosaccharomyces octosporus yFS286]|uniref:Uncharacterized protein n=1 Tax=Schizosaccharomyces octosporus (strain yFS286) TaxID=483514 RepID=S9PQ37_SCHOY|nr:uncharacterized protein SOCG_01569 [Schizosaccharomyces octosporus yFS286]EPX71351.1 hypothetical protein SOCG_01569 [Schizosaccharomyces octosporus yFS286]